MGGVGVAVSIGEGSGVTVSVGAGVAVGERSNPRLQPEIHKSSNNHGANKRYDIRLLISVSSRNPRKRILYQPQENANADRCRSAFSSEASIGGKALITPGF
jgi:hypothetical protein